MPRRGELWWASLDPTVGSEQSGTRPILVYQHDSLNEVSRTVVSIPLTSNLERRVLPTCVVVARGTGGLREDSVALCHQIRVLAVSRLRERIGTLSGNDLARIDAAVVFTLGIPGLSATA